MTLQLVLEAVPPETAGIYTIGGVPDRMPARSLFLHPDAAESFRIELASWAVCSDIFRSPESSLAAVRSGRGAQPPAFSPHNYGLAIDLALAASWRNFRESPKPLNKKVLDEWMVRRGWHCHRCDHANDHEAWHYNYLGLGVRISSKVRSTSGYVEARIVELYGSEFELDAATAQERLGSLRMYHGAADGNWGPLSREACRVFQRAWGLSETGRLDARTQRTLAYVTASKDLVS